MVGSGEMVRVGVGWVDSVSVALPLGVEVLHELGWALALTPSLGV